jgi:uncharacterized protein (DUF1800 family)
VQRRHSTFAVVIIVAALGGACAANPRPSMPTGPTGPTGAKGPQEVDTRAIIHLLNRTTFGPRPGDVDRIAAMGPLGVQRYLDEQLHPERIPDDTLDEHLASLNALRLTPLAFATDYYLPMIGAREQYTQTQAPKNGAKPAVLRGHLLPIAAMSLPGSDKPVIVLQQSSVTIEELLYQRKNQESLDALQAQKLLRAALSDRQLEEVLTDFWFNHFNVDARKIEDYPVVAAYEQAAIRPHVLGKFRDLLGATAKSPAMLFYLDNWLSSAPPPPPKPRGRVAAPARPSPAGRGLNENYAREIMELHTLGVDGGYTQRDVVEVARSFTGWTMRKPHEATGFEFNEKMHDRGEKHVLGHRIKAGRGIEDGEQVLDILARHPSTARFIATKLVRRFVADDPPAALVDRTARTFRRTDGDLREVVRTILTSPEFLAASAERTKVKTPFEFVVSALRATGADITTARVFVGSVATLGEPLFLCQPPTGDLDRASQWLNTGTLIARLNFAQALTANGLNGATLALGRSNGDPERLAALILGDDLSDSTRAVIQTPRAAPPLRTALLLGSPEFQAR